MGIATFSLCRFWLLQSEFPDPASNFEKHTYAADEAVHCQHHSVCIGIFERCPAIDVRLSMHAKDNSHIRRLSGLPVRIVRRSNAWPSFIFVVRAIDLNRIE